MKSFLTSVLLIFFWQVTFSQLKGNAIRGTIKDIQNEAVTHIAIRLLKAADSTFVKGEITNGSGKFLFSDVQNGQYLLAITGIGFKQFTGATLTIDNNHSNIILPVIILLPAQKKDLKEVVVVAKRQMIEQDIDRTIVNVDAMIGSATSNALEVLEKTPGVTVSITGDIGLNGKNSVLVLIDGRATYMSGQDLAGYLKSLPGGLLDKIELMDNPPAKFDAAGAAIINIRLKKSKTRGLTGNFSASYSHGVKGRTYEVINLNYNRKKVNWFGNIGYSKDGQHVTDLYERKFYSSNSALIAAVALQNKFSYVSHGLVTRVGLDYSVSPKTVVGLQVNLQTRPRQENSGFESISFDTGMKLDSINSGNTASDFYWITKGLNINFQHKFNNVGRELSADFNYINYRSDGVQQFNNLMRLPNGILGNSNSFKYDLVSAINIYNIKADYVHPLKNKGSFEAGIKSSVVRNDDDSRFFKGNDVNIIPDHSRSNHFLYHENINAAYVNIRKNWKRFGAQLGLRLENTRLKGYQLGNMAVADSIFTQNFTGLFPTAFVSYKLDSAGKNTVTTSIARRINRPNYQQLNPFLVFRDNYSYTIGNPSLNPQYQYRFELKYQYKQLLSTGVSYGHFTDVIFQTTETTKDNIFITRPNNIAEGYMLLFITNLSINPVKWWFVNVNMQVGHIKLNGNVYTEKLQPSINSGRINVMNQFTFNKGWSSELTGYFVTKDIIGQAIADARYRLYVAVQKKIFNDKASIKFTLDDIFHSWIQKDNSLSIKQSTSFHTNEADTQRFGVSFSWQFGNQNFARKRRHTDNAADTEKGRVE